MNLDSVIFQNIEHLINSNGITEHLCTINCNLPANFFSNFRSGKCKHFKMNDKYKIAVYFEVSLDYLCQYKNTRDEFFVPTHKLKPNDEKILLRAFRRLDECGRINVSKAINDELEMVRKREKEHNK